VSGYKIDMNSASISTMRNGSVKEKMYGFLLFLSFSTTSMYFFDSGGFQIVHVLLCLLFSLFFIFNRFKIDIISGCLLFIFSYSLLHESLVAISSGFYEDIIFPIYCLFNTLVYISISRVSSQNLLPYMVYGHLVSIIVAITSVVVSGVSLVSGDEGSYRAVGFFNNPNQLGYYAVCSFSMIYLFYRLQKLKLATTVLFSSLCLTLAAYSLSKAAILSIIPIAFFALVYNKKIFVIITLLFVLLIPFIYNSLVLNPSFYEGVKVVDRISSMGNENDSGFASRGYYGFKDGSSLEITFGQGYRAIRDIVGHEVHSSFAGLFNYYGFLPFLSLILLNLYWYYWLNRNFGFRGAIIIFAPPFLYALTHNGLRFSIFWMLIAVSMAVYFNRSGSKKCANSTV
jgi:hypothetical protein